MLHSVFGLLNAHTELSAHQFSHVFFPESEYLIDIPNGFSERWNASVFQHVLHAGIISGQCKRMVSSEFFKELAVIFNTPMNILHTDVYLH